MPSRSRQFALALVIVYAAVSLLGGLAHHHPADARPAGDVQATTAACGSCGHGHDPSEERGESRRPSEDCPDSDHNCPACQYLAKQWLPFWYSVDGPEDEPLTERVLSPSSQLVSSVSFALHCRAPPVS